ncbi:hypothetical protein C8Q78DRAFT_1080235 [Trametes maxima]|nr:hypothetical protein C8Q78DRAFT_1080235 [Trametes maxima]
MSSDPDYAQEVISARRLLIENYSIIVSSALLWFDAALTLPTEYRRIWCRKFTGATAVYLLTRYIAVIERVFFVLEPSLFNLSNKTYACGGITRTDDVLTFLNYLAFSAFTSLRVYAVWGRDWKPLMLVLPLTLVRPIGLVYESAFSIPTEFGSPYGCAYEQTLPDNVISNRGFCIANTFGIQKEGLSAGLRTPLATLLLRDGTAYFLVLLVIQLITIVSNQIGHSLIIWLVWPYFDQVITVIFLSRFILDLRGLYFTGSGEHEETTSTALHMSDVKFNVKGLSSQVVGNFGASLNTVLDVQLPSDSGATTPSPVSPTEGYGDAYNYEWEDEALAYCEDPFSAGMKNPERPPALEVEHEAAVELENIPRLPLCPARGSEIEEEKRLNCAV